MMRRNADASPLFKARTAGFFWMMVFLAGSLALFVGRGVVSSVANIVAALMATRSFVAAGWNGELLEALSRIMYLAESGLASHG